MVQAAATGSRSRSHEPDLLLGLAPGASLGIVLVEAAGRRLEERVRARHMEHRGAELAHQDGGAALGVVGQDRDRRAVVLHLPRHRMPVGDLDRELQELPPALVQRLDGRDAMESMDAHSSTQSGSVGPFEQSRVPRLMA